MPVAQRAPGKWQIATVSAIEPETPSVKSFRLSLPMWMPHLPGQHYDVRLTAPDGYTAQRSYSIASSPLDRGQIELNLSTTPKIALLYDPFENGEAARYAKPERF